MHRQIPVAELEIDNNTGLIERVGKVYAPEHLPIGVKFKRGICDRAALNEWWGDRSIPTSRSGIREALTTLGVSSPKLLLTRCYGLSLSDQYWIVPVDSGLTWDQVNFFEHDFSEDIGDVLFGAAKKPDPLGFSSPDNTSDGNLKKRWKIIDGKRCLIKGGSNPYRQQPLNEVIATEIMNRLDIPCVPYTVTWHKGAPYSICEDFITAETELIPAWRIIQSEKKRNDTSLYQHFVNCADHLGIPDVRPFLDRMIVLDYIIANEDRHLNNFGAVRKAETLAWIGMAPIYDSGSSLGYDKSIPLMKDESEIECKPFKKHHNEQLKLVSSFEWIDFDKLSDVPQMIIEILSDERARDYMEERRIQVIAELTRRRIEKLRAAVRFGSHVQVNSTEDDVEQNIAAEYNNP
ncbi:MAG: HipA domain-containing protein [Lachnospiraceae bacterium]|nr:HipA domain-containing protein [Lachnospiraceae bacterium]